MSRNSRNRLGEFELIAQLFAPLATSRAALGLRDDVALLRAPNGRELVLTTDAIVEAVHFLPNDPPRSVAQKALRANLSDLAAKGADPIGYLMAIAIPSRVSTRWLNAFCAGLRADQKTYAISLLGGDTTRIAGPLTVAITMIGSVPRKKALRREGARPGDLVFVSGTIGDAGCGLELLKTKRRGPQFLIKRFRVPQPRLTLGRALRGLATSSIDVSDGLLADLGHIAEVSGVRIAMRADEVPLSSGVREIWGHGRLAVIRAATAGDDYEVAFTCRPESARKVREAALWAKTRITEIGVVERGKGVELLDARGKAIRTGRRGYTHF
jgi:thiamine-monophosphate kinase